MMNTSRRFLIGAATLGVILCIPVTAGAMDLRTVLEVVQGVVPVSLRPRTGGEPEIESVEADPPWRIYPISCNGEPSCDSLTFFMTIPDVVADLETLNRINGTIRYGRTMRTASEAPALQMDVWVGPTVDRAQLRYLTGRWLDIRRRFLMAFGKGEKERESKKVHGR
ncbi:MAG: YbjN domain-containing protein [Alphaproteobacteria bacterium]